VVEGVRVLVVAVVRVLVVAGLRVRVLVVANGATAVDDVVFGALTI